MIAEHPDTCSTPCVKKFIAPSLRPFRALFFLLLFQLFPPPAKSQMMSVDSLIRLVEQRPQNDSTKIHWMHTISYMLSESDVSRSFAYYSMVSRLSDSLNFTYGKALGNINLGILLSSSGNFDASTNAFIKAIDQAKECNEPRIEAVALNDIGENFASLKDFDKCREYALQAVDINMKLGAGRGVAINYELIHRCDLEQGYYTSAKLNLDKGMPYALGTRENYILSSFYLGYGKLHAINNRNDSANYYFNKAIRTAQEKKDLRNEFQVYLAEVKYLKHITEREKIVNLGKAMKLAEQTQYAEGIAKDAEQLSNAYDALNNRDSSLFYYRMYRSVSDSLFSENNQRRMIVNESEWTIRKKELENNNLKQLAATQKRQIAFSNILLFLIGIGFLLTVFVAFLLYKSFQAKKLKDVSQYKQKIAETEMQALQAQMNPHFFFNSLNSIENFIMQNEKKLASDYLNKFARFIRSILDSSNNDLIEMNKDLESLQLYIDLELLRFNNKFRYFINVDPRLLQGDYQVPALLVQPFLENAINHGIGPSERTDLKICLKVRLINNMIHYIIEDNGIGRDQSKVYNQLNKPFHKSVGMKLTQDRINIFNQQDGTSESVKIIDLFDEDHHPAGTRIEFALKVVTHASPQSHPGR
jgi:two-component sensor histidine kinase